MSKIDKLAMKQGYKEMAEINLTIAQEFFHSEEGAKGYDKLDRTKAEGKAN